jgi:hypothetical protein
MLPVIELAGAVVDEQAFLDGTREITVAAGGTREGPAAPWELTLTFRRPKEPDAVLNEGDLTLTGPDGAAIYATLRSGSAAPGFDEDTGDELVRLDLSFEVGSAEGAAADVAAVRLHGTLTGQNARLTAELRSADG